MKKKKKFIKFFLLSINETHTAKIINLIYGIEVANEIFGSKEKKEFMLI